MLKTLYSLGDRKDLSSDDEFGEDAGDDEQGNVIKAIKFPEIEGPTKYPSAAPKVSKRLQKRVRHLQDIVAKFDAAPKLDAAQTSLLTQTL